MKSENDYLESLLARYLSGNASDQEIDELLAHFQDPHFAAVLKDGLFRQIDSQLPPIDPLIIKPILERLDRRVLGQTAAATGHPKRIGRWKRTIPAIAALFLIGLFLYFFNARRTSEATATAYDQPIEPGGNRAYLSLADGRVLPLLEDRGGLVVQGTQLTYEDGTLLLGADEESDVIPKPMLRTDAPLVDLCTPKAGQFSILLSDGTKVWLNAASTLTYPEHFSKSRRVVKLEGEAYFEVAPDPSRPFLVETGRQTIEVLGTKFNIQAYADEQSHQTTLMEGRVSVKLLLDHEEWELQPNQQLTIRDGKIQVAEVDASEFYAWIHGLILLNNYDLAEIVRQLERWYDVEFDPLPLNIQHKRVFGSLKKDVPLQDVLRSLEENYGIKFLIRERRVLIDGL